MTKGSEDRTKKTYAESARSLAEYFSSLDAREDDIERAFDLVGGTQNSAVLELGCGDGRDASAILKRTRNYTGIDYSKGLIELAKQSNPGHDDRFLVADMRSFAPADGQRYAIIFAFASLIHLEPSELKSVLEKYIDMLRPGGIIYVSMKYSDHHITTTKEDKHGWRLYHLYSPEELSAMIPESTEVYKNICIRISKNMAVSSGLPKPFGGKIKWQ